MRSARKPRNEAKTVAVGCDRLPFAAWFTLQIAMSYCLGRHATCNSGQQTGSSLIPNMIDQAQPMPWLERQRYTFLGQQTGGSAAKKISVKAEQTA